MFWTSLPRSTRLVYGIFAAATVIDQYRMLKLHRKLQKAYKMSLRDRHTVAYLIDILQRHNVPFDDFDALALTYYYPEYFEEKKKTTDDS